MTSQKAKPEQEHIYYPHHSPTSMECDKKKARTTNEAEDESLFDHFCQVSSCMGIIDWYHASYVGKLFWSILLTFCILFTGYQIYNCFNQMINGPPFQTSVSQEMQPDGIPFPKVTICNYNRAKQSLIEKSGIDPKVLTYMFNFFPTAAYDIPFAGFDDKEMLNEHEQAWLNHTASGGQADYFKLLQEYSHNTSMLMKFSFGNRIQHDEKIPEVFTMYGRCWQITVPLGKQAMQGSYFGLKLIIDPELDDYMVNGSLNNFLQTGIVMSFSYMDEPLMPKPVSIAPGTSTSIALRLSQHKFTGSSPSLRNFSCTSNLTLDVIKAEYTVQNCAFDCYTMVTINICGCIKLAVTKVPYPMCNFSTGSKCDDTYVDKNSTFIDAYKECAKKCLPPCNDYFTIDHSVTSTSFVPKTSVDQLVEILYPFRPWYTRQQMLDMIHDSIAVDVYFDTSDMIIMETTESIPLITFIGNFGGQLGLLTGSSILTIVQCMYYLVVWCSLSKKRQNRSAQKSQVQDAHIPDIVNKCYANDTNFSSDSHVSVVPH